ncbi:MAG: cytochrome c [Sulfurospirillaceae bacterium]|nr:cytochrome c [Sulfurospirillaceae bacterium]
MRIFFIVFLLSVAVFGEDFITKMEYAKMLYVNPRGIGCDECHGKKGEGMIIAKYKVKGKPRVLKAPPINSLKKEVFYQALHKSHKVMPTYFLTDKEIDVLYFYVKSEANK